MAKEASTMRDATILLSRVPALATSPEGSKSTLRNILDMCTAVRQDTEPNVPRIDFEFDSPAGNMHVMLFESPGPDAGPENVHLVGLHLQPRTEDGYQAPGLDIWYGGQYTMAGYFAGTNTEMHLSVADKRKSTTAMLFMDLQGPVPGLRLVSKMYSNLQPMLESQLEHGNIILAGEQKGFNSRHPDILLFDVEGIGDSDSFMGFKIMGRNKAGEEKPVPVVIPKKVTVT